MTAATSHRGALIVASLLTFGLVFAGFLTLETPGLGLANFYYFAIALVALALGPYFGAAAGGGAAGLYALGIVLNENLPTAEVLAQSAWIRLITYAGIGFLIGSFAHRNQELVVQLRLLAERDALTGLPNTRGFEAAMSRRLAGDASFALLLGDMDGLKLINDSRGHAEGNEVLKRLAVVLGEALRDDDEVARIGGDEFAVLSSVYSGEEARRLAERLEAAAAAEGTRVTFGWAVSPLEGAEALTLFRAADQRLYERKSGRSRVGHGETLRLAAPAAGPR
jgi:diguanylate cyclase (GGDEF)-like protein